MKFHHPNAKYVLGAGLGFVLLILLITGQTVFARVQAVGNVYMPIVIGGAAGTITATATTTPTPTATPTDIPSTPELGEYALIGWNDLGMHCYNRDFQDLAVLPPYNTLWVQVIQRGNPPQIVTQGITVTYSFPANTYSVGKSNFWDYDLALFGVDLAPNIGLTDKGLSGEMDRASDHFIAEGIPITEYDDNDWINRQPYQLAEVIARDSHGNELARNSVVVPVSTEMRCDNCHADGMIEEIATGRVETNILTLHDNSSGGDYPPGHTTLLMDRRPVLCAECHASNALEAAGLPGIPNLSKAMHEKHAERVPNTTAGCYNCHPGPSTQCLRDVMSQQHGMTCIDCHGSMADVAANPNPWLNEPRCDGCHTEPKYAQNNALYRFSTGHGGVSCEACHDSTHAIAPSNQPRDAIKFINLQGHSGTLDVCTVCHLTQPTEGGPHP